MDGTAARLFIFTSIKSEILFLVQIPQDKLQLQFQLEKKQ